MRILEAVIPDYYEGNVDKHELAERIAESWPGDPNVVLEELGKLAIIEPEMEELLFGGELILH